MIGPFDRWIMRKSGAPFVGATNDELRRGQSVHHDFAA